MKKDTGFYGIVQEYFETRILYGFYVYGDRLPSIQKLCVIFAMAPATIRSALGQLEKQGYIKVDARKGSEVIYQASPAKFRENISVSEGKGSRICSSRPNCFLSLCGRRGSL